MNDIPTPITPMYFYNTFVLPIYFDDSLDSYQKLLKIQYKINEIIANQTGIIDWLNQLKQWIDSQLEMYAKERLNEWLADGTLERIINQEIFGELNDKVNLLMGQRIYHMNSYVSPDGNTDNTILMQKAINESAGHILVIDGSSKPYRCNQLTLQPNSIYWCQPNAVIKANDTWITTDRWQDPLIDIRMIENVKWFGNNAEITMNKPATLVTEHAHCMGTRGSKNVYVENMNLTNASGDGFYLDQYDGDNTNKPSSDITLKNLNCDGNGRNGISVVSAHDIEIVGCMLSHTKGTAPQAGIDIESELRSPNMQNIKVHDCNFNSNGFCGLLFSGQASNPQTLQTVFIDSCTFNNENTGVYINGIKPDSLGNIIVSNCDIRNCQRNSILDGNNSNSGIKRTYINCVSLNANSANRAQNDGNIGEWGWACAFQIYAKDQNCGNVRFINCISDDNRETPLVKTAFGLTRNPSSTNVINLVELTGCNAYKTSTSVLGSFNDIYGLQIDETLPRNRITPSSTGADFINAKNNYC